MISLSHHKSLFAKYESTHVKSISKKVSVTAVNTGEQELTAEHTDGKLWLSICLCPVSPNNNQDAYQENVVLPPREYMFTMFSKHSKHIL